MIKAAIHALVSFAVLTLVGLGNAQTVSPPPTSAYPSRPVRVIVPYPAGGPTDVIARTIAQKLSENLGRQFYVENHGGASGDIGTGIAAKAPPDGHTILFMTNDLAVHYDHADEFTPVTLVAESPEVIVVHPSVPARSLKELVALLKANPQKYSFASPGTGTSTHLAAERLFRLTNGLDLVHVPFAGGAPALTSTIGGHTLIAITALPPAAPYIKEGTLRALAVTSKRRSPAFPNVPTLAEAGFPDHESSVLIGVVVPARTPKSVVDLLYGQIVQIARSPDVKNSLAVLGFDPVVNRPDEFAARIDAEVARWGKIARMLNLKQ
jgi:tripartite-type tricarboxylate transporter receptor subunit TctC